MCSLDFFFRLFLLYQDKRNEHQAALAAKKECGTTVKVKTEKLATESTETERLGDREKKREFFHRSLFRIIRYNS